MKALTEILESIVSVNERYRTLKMSFISDQTEMLRDLSCAYSDLIQHKSEAKDEWLDSYNLFKGSNAAKQRFADSEVRHYSLIKDNLTAIKIKIDVMRTTVSANKQQ